MSVLLEWRVIMYQKHVSKEIIFIKEAWNCLPVCPVNFFVASLNIFLSSNWLYVLIHAVILWMYDI